MNIMAIDPGNIESAYVVIDDEYKVLSKGKIDNHALLTILKQNHHDIKYVAIEMIASYGMAVGKTVFDTCVWIGRFEQALIENKFKVEHVYRKDIKMNLCGSNRAKDTNVTQALIDRFAPNTRNKGKGTKDDQGWFYGFKKDIWQAYAVAVTYKDEILSV